MHVLLANITHLKKPPTSGPARDVYSLCLSIGTVDGLGETRAVELGNSLDFLGIDECKRWVLDIPCVHAMLTYSVILISPR
jgi:hypothetical protein